MLNMSKELTPRRSCFKCILNTKDFKEILQKDTKAKEELTNF